MTSNRSGELSRGVLAILAEAPDGMPDDAVFEQLETAVPPTPDEREDSAKTPGVRRYEEAVRSSTIALVKTGWMTKSEGTWHITDTGREALSKLSDPEAFYTVAVSRRAISKVGEGPSEAGDLFAGCAVSVAGSLVGTVIGTAVLLVRMLPELSLGGLLAGLAAAFVVGVVAGLILMWPIGAIANGIATPRRAESIWVYGTGLAAGIAASLTPSLLIAVE